MRRAVAAGALLLACASAAAQAPSLQPWVDATPEGGLLEPPPGVYEGPVVVRRPLRIDGRGEVRIDAGGRGSVVELLTDDAVLRGLELVNSGENHDTIDAGVRVRGSGNVIEHNVIDDCLFGVDLQQSDRNVVRGNRIRSKPLEMGVRGDSVRLWYSRENRIEDNVVSDVRDMVVWYSADNVIARNRVTGSRYALHFMYSKQNLVEANHYEDNTVGIFLMYSDGVVVRGNRIEGAAGATGMGVGFKESSEVVLEDNVLVGNSRGLYLDISPYQPDTTNLFRRNRFAYNGVGVMFHNDWEGNVFEDNDFQGNFTQVAVQGGGTADRNVWRGNRWDDYRGFDRDLDGRGDTPYDLYAYADRIWQEIPATAFFRGSPLFEAIDFLDRLAPFSLPDRILRDPEPRFEIDAASRARTGSPAPPGARPWPR